MQNYLILFTETKEKRNEFVKFVELVLFKGNYFIIFVNSI